MGLREKARQGLLTGSLPWGYVKGEDEHRRSPTPRRRPTCSPLFEMYADRPAHRPHARRVAERATTAHHSRPSIRCGHRARDALQRRLLPGTSPRERDTHQGDQGPTRADRARGAVRPRAGDAPPARPHTQARAALRRATCCAASRTADAATPRCRAPASARELRRALLLLHPSRQSHACDQPVVPAETVERQLVEFIAGLRARRQPCARDPAPARHRQQHREQRDRPAPRSRLRSACAGCATSTNSATSPPRVRRAPRRDQRRAGRARARSRSPTSTTRAACSKTSRSFWTTRDRPDAKRQFLHAHLRGRLAGRTPRRRRPAQALIPAVLREPRSGKPRKMGVKYGSDGTRTRDLRRDRPAL